MVTVCVVDYYSLIFEADKYYYTEVIANALWPLCLEVNSYFKYLARSRQMQMSTHTRSLLGALFR